MLPTAILTTSHNDADYKLLLRAFDLTCHKDYVELTRKLLRDIRQLKRVVSANVYEVCGCDNPLQSKNKESLVLKDVVNILKAPVSLDTIIKKCPTIENHKQHVTTRYSDSLLQTTLPIFNGSVLERVVVIESAELPEIEWESILFSLGIYGKLLTTIDEKERDRITGLFNRHTFDGQVPDIIEFSRQAAMIVRPDCEITSWLAILDIDNFQKINDAYGHEVGDKVLQHFSKLMEESFHYSDVLFRYDGGKFIVALNGYSKETALNMLESFRKQIEVYSFPENEQVTVSSGFIQILTQDGSTSLLDEAHNALNYAKSTGRNKTIFYSEQKMESNTEQELESLEPA